MLFNMSEDEWDAVISVHLKGHFTVYRHAMATMRKQEKVEASWGLLLVPLLLLQLNQIIPLQREGL
jgi:NAD(P)-dependent dehydrogenase (short-subunit alcohol dehydrogenase family)